MPVIFTALIPGELRYRDLAGAMVSSVCARIEAAGGVSGLEWQMLSAYNEAFNNIAEHAYAEGKGDVEVTLQVEDELVTLRLADEGVGYDFSRSGAWQTPEFDTLADGGMGLFIIRRLMSEVRYERDHGRNMLTMTKKLSDCAGATSATEG